MMRCVVFAVLFGTLFLLRLRTHNRAVQVLPASVANRVQTNDAHPVPATGTMSSTQMRLQWREAVTTVLATYAADHEALRARDALLALTVATADQDTHLHLVLALDGLARQTKGAEKSWKVAVRAFAP